jgi:hypothetical protein
MTIQSAFWVLCIFYSLSCSLKSKNTELPLITEFIVDSVFLPITESNHQISRIKEIGDGVYQPDEIVGWVSERSYKFYAYDVANSVFVDSTSLSDYSKGFIDFFSASKDSVFVGQETNKVSLVMKNAVKTWDIGPVTKRISRHAFIGYLSGESLQVFNDTVFCITSTSERKKSEGPNLPFIRDNYDINFKLHNDSVQSLVKYNPNPSYLRTHGFYSHADRTYLNSQELIYSFNHSDTLTKINLFTGARKLVKIKTTNFHPNTLFDYKRVQDYKYLSEYEMSQSRIAFGGLFHDKHRHLIYVLMKHKGLYIDDDGRKNKWYELPFSLFQFDNELNQLKELLIPPGMFGSHKYTFITHKALYFAAHESRQKHHDKMLFYRIVIK